MHKVSLAALIFFEDMEGGWAEYQEKLYSVFCRDLKDTGFTFRGKTVKIRYQPIEFGKEEAFFHITCQDYKKDGDRVPDFRRCERIASDSLSRRLMQTLRWNSRVLHMN